MSEEQHQVYLEEVKKAIESTIKVVVNGKIDGLRKDFEAYVKSDMEWKTIAEPIIKAGNSLTATGKLAVYFFGGLATIAGGVAVIKYALISLIK